MEGDSEVQWLLDEASLEDHPEVSPDGRWIAYESVEPGETLGIGNAEVLFEGMRQYLFQPGRRAYDVSPDGQRFLMLKVGDAVAGEASAPPQAILIQNWAEELKRLVPTE